MIVYHIEHMGDPLPELAPEDAVKPQAKYYYKGAAQLSPENYEATRPGRAIDVKDAIYPDQLNKVIDHSPIAVETGYCLLPDGGGYAAVCTHMKGVTMPMIGWYGKWKMEDPFNYSIWCPGSHIYHSFDWAVEDLGFGISEITQQREFTMDDFNFDPQYTTKESGFVMAAGGNWFLRKIDGPLDEPPIMCIIFHTVRQEAPDELVWRTRFFIGYSLKDGKYKNELLPGQVITEEIPRCFAEHSAYEMATRQRDLPSLYAEFAAK